MADFSLESNTIALPSGLFQEVLPAELSSCGSRLSVPQSGH